MSRGSTDIENNLRRFRPEAILLVLGFISIGILRFVYCFQVPWHTTDLLRNLGYGREFWNHGFAIYNYTPQDFSPHPCQFLWEGHHYTYPAVTALFFALLSLVSPGLIAAKLWLTILDTVNTLMIGRITRDRVLAFLYWMNPIGVWHVSHEGQFEAFVSFWIIISIWLWRKRSPWAFCVLAGAIQTKLFPVLLVPTFFLTEWHVPFREWSRRTALFALGFLPSLIAVTQGEYITAFLSPGYIPKLNHISWSITNPTYFKYQPWWLVVVNAITSTGTLFFIVLLLRKGRVILDYVPCFLFLFFLKCSPLTQFWYLQLFPVFALTVQHRQHRRWLFIAGMTMGTRSVVSMLGVRFGYMNPPEVMALQEVLLWVIP